MQIEKRDIIENEVLIPKKKEIKENFFLGFSMIEFISLVGIGIIFFVIFDFFDRMFAYKVTLTVVVFTGFLLIEVPTTQLRFYSILKKMLMYFKKQKEFYLDTKKKKEGM